MISRPAGFLRSMVTLCLLRFQRHEECAFATQRRIGPNRAGVVSASGVLDFDDVGAEVTEDLGGERTRENAREIDNPYPGEWAGTSRLL